MGLDKALNKLFKDVKKMVSPKKKTFKKTSFKKTLFKIIYKKTFT